MMGTIPYVDRTWNPLVGCSHASPGCDHCYAARLAATRLAHMPAYSGLASKGRWSGEVRLLPEKLSEPLRWRKPQTIFVCDMGDLYHPSVPFEFIAAVYGVMAASQHTFLTCTKRPERRVEFMAWVARPRGCSESHLVQQEAWSRVDKFPLHHVKGTFKEYPWPLLNVWEGVTVCTQAEMDRVAKVINPNYRWWISLEPTLERSPTQSMWSRLGSVT